MPLGSTTLAFKAAVEGTAYRRVAAATLTPPVVGTLTFGAAPLGALQAFTFEEGDQSSYPSDLKDQSGLTNVAGSVTLGGSVMISGAPVTVTRLFNPDDVTSTVSRQKLVGAPITLSVGVVDADGTTELVDRSGYVTTIEVQQSQGLVVVNWADVPPGFNALPQMNAVLVAPPYNSGLTSEFVMDRIARAGSGGAISSWPAQRANCVLAVGMRSSLWPEVGQLDPAASTPNAAAFTAGVYGTGLDMSASPTATYQYSSGSPIYLEFLMSGLTSTGSLPITFAGLKWTISSTGVALADAVGSLGGWSGTINSSAHWVGLRLTAPVGGSFTASVIIDGTAHTIYTGTATAGVGGLIIGVFGIGGVASHAVVEALQATTETSPTPRSAFTPAAVFDPSLNPLQAVPAIDAGTNAYDELQTVAEAELGWIGFRDGVLTFLNRNTFSGQAVSRTVTAQASLMDMESSTVGASTLFDDIAIDYTEYQFDGEAMVYTPKKALKVAAHSTLTITRPLPDGLTVGAVDQSFAYQSADTATPGSLNSVFRASLDRNGVNEIPDTSILSGTVSAVTPSQIQISITNSSGPDVWLVSPSNYTAIPVGTPSVWVNGLPVTPDDASIVHVNAGSRTSTYQAPSNPYRQDRDATIATGNFLLAMLSTPTILYGSVDMVPDPRVTVPDRVTLDVPVDGGVTPIDVFVWGNTLSGSFDQDSAEWTQTLDVRAVAGPGAWILGTSILGTSTYVY